MTAIRIISQQLLLKYQFCRTPMPPNCDICCLNWELASTVPAAGAQRRKCLHRVPAELNSESAVSRITCTTGLKQGRGSVGGGGFTARANLNDGEAESRRAVDWLARRCESAPGSFSAAGRRKTNNICVMNSRGSEKEIQIKTITQCLSRRFLPAHSQTAEREKTAETSRHE